MISKHLFLLLGLLIFSLYPNKLAQPVDCFSMKNSKQGKSILNIIPNHQQT